MKFWQLISICREKDGIERALKSAQPQKYYEWFRDLEGICKIQDRAKLDATVPNELVSKALSACLGTVYFCKADGTLRSYPFAETEQKMSYLDAWNNFGATALEEALEKGSFKVQK